VKHHYDLPRGRESEGGDGPARGGGKWSCRAEARGGGKWSCRAEARGGGGRRGCRASTDGGDNGAGGGAAPSHGLGFRRHSSEGVAREQRDCGGRILGKKYTVLGLGPMEISP
jgi:hypothetical protein